jgi:hypothetical protein
MKILIFGPFLNYLKHNFEKCTYYLNLEMIKSTGREYNITFGVWVLTLYNKSPQ